MLAVDKSSGSVIGTAWLRRWCGGERGYGYVDDETPELTIAVCPEHRGKGVGSELLRRLLETAGMNRKTVSLSVDRLNPAIRLYKRFGFKVVIEHESDVTMLWMQSK